MLFLNQRSRLKEDAIIGLIFSLLASAFYGVIKSDVGEYPDDYSRQRAGDRASGYCATARYRRVSAILLLRVERSDGRLFR